MNRLSLVLLVGFALAGCGLAHTVDKDLLSDIGVEHKLLLFDAENDVSIAIDEREILQRQIRDLKKDIARVEAQIADAEEDEARADEKGNGAQADLSAQAQEVFALKGEYLEAELDLLRARHKAQEDLIRVALARYELAKAKLIKKNNVPGASDVEVEDFELQVEDTVETARDVQRDLKAEAEEVDQMRQVWLDAREKLQQASGGGLGSPWAEDSGIWGR